MKRPASLLTAAILSAVALSTIAQTPAARVTAPEDPDANLTNLAPIATSSTSYCSPDQTLAAINDGISFRNRVERNAVLHYGNWPTAGTQWVEYTWSKPISTNKVAVLWYDDNRGLRLPKACRVKYWNGSDYVPVPNAKGLGLDGGHFNNTTFDEISTSRIRLEIDAAGQPPTSTGITEFRVYDSGHSPAFPPTVNAGIERDVVLGGRTFLIGSAKTLQKGDEPSVTYQWSAAGPGTATFEDAKNPATSATFSATGDYTLTLSATANGETATNSLLVHVKDAAPAIHADSVFTRSYSLDSPLWNSRVKSLVTHWIPHLIDYLEHPEKHLTGKTDKNGQPIIFGAGGIDNFIEAGKKNRGETVTAKHLGPPWSDAYTHNTVEAMCVALTIDPKGDAEIIAAQKQIKDKLNEWIPIILAAQEPDGYLQTRFTLNGGNHWDPRTRGEHEGYTAGYFIESAIAHYVATDGKDMRMYNAAKKLADCWYKNVGPESSNKWFDGHQEIEQALVRFARLVDQVEGPHTGDKYVQLAKTLLDNRRGGTSYDQSHLPVTHQYEALGHAVRAAYTYSGMAAVSEESGDLDYQSAVQSLWDSIVNRKYYITGGIGSGETSEGFGPNYSLRNNAYCESCSNCGELFFQYSLNLQYRDAKYADLYEGTIYNAILGDTDLAGDNFCYTNALDTTDSPHNPARYPWHDCPCCVGNIPRTLLQLPTWTYNTTADSLAINLFIGSTFTIKGVGGGGGTDLQVIQKTDYPWNGNVAITLNPATPKNFAVKIRIPHRSVSTLYSSTPEADGITSISLNGQIITPPQENGYAVISREWRPGDKIDLVLPMAVQRVKAIDKVAADRGRVALTYGPLVYNIESVDQDVDKVLADDAPLHAEWDPALLGGVMVIKGRFTDGSPMLAIPNYARLNRGGRSIVWIKDQP